MKIQLLRHATMIIEIAGKQVLVDPMLSEPGQMPAIPGVANSSDNPLVALPVNPSGLTNADAVIVTHTHSDHFDEAAIRVLPHDRLLFCQPADTAKIIEAGFTNAIDVDAAYQWEGITITRTAGQHGTGKIGQKMGPVSGFVLESSQEPSLYIAGDTIWCTEVQEVLDKHQPQVIVCFAGGAQFASGDPITMTKEDILAVCRHAPAAKVIAVHLEAWNHCSLTRQALKDYAAENMIADQLLIPDDGEWIII